MLPTVLSIKTLSAYLPNQVHPFTFHLLGITLKYPRLDLLEETTVGVASRLVFLPLKDFSIADGQLPAGTLTLILLNITSLLFLLSL